MIPTCTKPRKATPKPQDGTLIGDQVISGIQSRKGPHRWDIVQGFFHARIGQGKPLLHKVNPQHGGHREGLAPTARTPLGLNRRHQGLQTRPGNHGIHLGQKLLALGLLGTPT